MEEYKSNSNKIKEENRLEKREKLKPVVNRQVVRKENKFKKLIGGIIAEDAGNVGSYILGEVIFPNLKKVISDIVTDGIDMILYGESRKNKKYNTADKVSYRNYYDSDRRKDYREPIRSNRYAFDDLVLKDATRVEAQEVIYRLNEIHKRFGMVSIADLYELVGIDDDNYMNNGYGWFDVSSASVVRVRDGYMIKMPKVTPLN